MRLNGKSIQLEKEQTLLDCLTEHKFDLKTIAVELNGVIIPKKEYESIRLSDEDTLEIVRFVGGG